MEESKHLMLEIPKKQNILKLKNLQVIIYIRF